MVLCHYSCLVSGEAWVQSLDLNSLGLTSSMYIDFEFIYLFISKIYSPKLIEVLTGLFLVSISPPRAGGGAGSRRVWFLLSNKCMQNI